MSILTKDVVLDYIKQKKIGITPFDKKAVGPASVDLTLDSELRIFNAHTQIIEARDSTDYKKITKKISIKEGYVLMPGEMVLGITKERISLPGNICGWLNSRSRYARIGLVSHVTAPFMSPGINNKQVLEIFNSGNQPIRLIPGEKICQIVFQECIGEAIYTGKFKQQKL